MDHANNKRERLSIEKKLEVISEIENGSSQAEVCSKLTLKQSSVSGIWKNRQHLKNVFNRLIKKKTRIPSHPKVDQFLLNWYREAKFRNEIVNGLILQKQAEDIGKLIGDPFKCSSGWINRFKRRHGIFFGKNIKKLECKTLNRNLVTSKSNVARTSSTNKEDITKPRLVNAEQPSKDIKQNNGTEIATPTNSQYVTSTNLPLDVDWDYIHYLIQELRVLVASTSDWEVNDVTHSIILELRRLRVVE